MTTSSPSTEPAPQSEPRSTIGDAGAAADTQAQFSTLTGDEGQKAIDAAKAALEGQLQQERDARNEERFVWIVVCVILIDVLWFRGSANALLPIAVLILQLVLLLVLAKRMGIEEIMQLVDRVLSNVGRGAGSGG